MKINAENIISLTDADLIYGNIKGVIFSGVSTDSRTINKDEIFISLQGENFDGHNFIANAIEKSAKGVIIESGKKELALTQIKGNIPVFAVKNTLNALQSLAKGVIQKMNAKKIAITGSVGKTECKDLTAHILNKMGFKVGKTKENFNNHIGVPLSILSFEGNENFVVIEMAMNAPGEIKALSNIVNPHCGVVTTVAPAHLEKLGTIENVANAKGELYTSLSEDGFAVVNYDNPYCIKIMKKTRAKIIKFGSSDGCEIQILQQGLTSDAKAKGVLFYNGKKHFFEMPVFGKHHITNLAGAIGACFAFEIFPENLTEILKDFPTPSHRTKVFNLNGIKIIDDTYNASPLSMQCAIELLREIGEKKRKIAVLGDMLELGEMTKFFHFEIGKFLATQGINLLFSTGKNAKFYCEGAISAGFDEERTFFCEDVIETGKILSQRIKENDCILIKGSRAMKMERILNIIMEKYQK